VTGAESPASRAGDFRSGPRGAEDTSSVTESSQHLHREARVPINVVVSRADDVEPGLYLAVNVSVTGICLRSTRKEKVGGFVALSFHLDGNDLHLYAEVIWCRPDAGEPAAPYLVGMKWATPSAAVTRIIRAYVDRALARSAPG
jgi:hypothetical protein